MGVRHDTVGAGGGGFDGDEVAIAPWVARLGPPARPASREEAPPDRPCGLRGSGTVNSLATRRDSFGLRCRWPATKFGKVRNHSARRPVLQGVRKNRAVGAVLVASCVALSGCASGGGEEPTTTSTPVAQGPTNPWELPLEQRPPLFDPCAEIPVEAVSEGVGSPMESSEDSTIYDPPGLISCAWSNDEVLISVLSTWKSHSEYSADPSFGISDRDYKAVGRSGIQLYQPEQMMKQSCHSLFFTGEGTVMVSLSLLLALNDFRGTRLSEGCEVLNQVSDPIVDLVPGGDFR